MSSRANHNRGMAFLRGLFEEREVQLSARLKRHMTQTTASGITITPDSALQISAVYGCVRILSESVAQLPFVLYERFGDDSKRRAIDHPLYDLLLNSPNSELTAFELRELLMVHLCLRGNAYCEIVWGRDGHVRALWPLHPDRVWPVRGDDNLLYYDVTTGWSGGYERYRHTVRLHPRQVLHLRSMGTDGVMGLSPIALHKQGIGLAAATEEFGARFFGNDARPGGVLEHPGVLGDEAHKRLSGSWESRHGGLSNSHRIAILEEGMTYNQIGIAPEEAQFLETRKFQVNDIARIFRVPPHMLADLDRATFSNIEHQSIEFVVHTLGPWLVRFEQAAARDLLLPSERRRYFTDYMVDALLRGDIQSRYQAYAVGRQNGWLSANDIRRMENMNAVDGGDVYLVPLNMVPADSLTGRVVDSAETNPTPPNDDDADKEERGEDAAELIRGRRAASVRHRLYGSHRRLFVEAARSLLRNERADVVVAATERLGQRSGTGEFRTWLDDFYSADFEQNVIDGMQGAASTYLEEVREAVRDEGYEHDDSMDRWLRRYLEVYAARHMGASRAAIDAALDADGDPLENVVAVADRWQDDRAGRIATDETVRLGNAVVVAIYAVVGVRSLRWHSFGDSCPYCRALNGKTVGIDSYFLKAGDDFQPDGAEIVLRPSSNVRHPPIHGGCDCMVSAA